MKQITSDIKKELEERLDLLLIKQNYFHTKITFRTWEQYCNECIEYEEN